MVNKKKVIKICSKNDIDNLFEKFSISTLLIEVSQEGRVLREIGLDENNTIIHKCPSKAFEYGTYGLFDLVIVDFPTACNEIKTIEFEKLWGK